MVGVAGPHDIRLINGSRGFLGLFSVFGRTTLLQCPAEYFRSPGGVGRACFRLLLLVYIRTRFPADVSAFSPSL